MCFFLFLAAAFYRLSVAVVPAFLPKSLLRAGKQELDAVQLVYLGGTGIVIDGGEICLRIELADHFGDTLADNVIRKASEWLDTDDVGHTALDELHHFSGEEPSLTGLIADIDDGLCVFDDLEDAGRSFKMTASRTCSPSCRLPLTAQSKRPIRPPEGKRSCSGTEALRQTGHLHQGVQRAVRHGCAGSARFP